MKLEDGLVRIEFQFEKPPMRVSDLSDWQKKSIFGPMFGNHGGIVGSTGDYPGVVDKYSTTGSTGWINTSSTYSQVNVNGMLRGIDYSTNGSATAQAASASIDKYCADNGIINQMDLHDGMATMDWMNAEMPRSKNDVGITVPGSKSTQKFTTTYMNAMEDEKHTIVLKLLGETEDNKPVLKPVTTKHKPKCITCGKQNKATAKFCTECGTALEIFA